MSNATLHNKLAIESKKIISDIQDMAMMNDWCPSAFLLALTALKSQVQTVLHPYTHTDFPPDYAG